MSSTQLITIGETMALVTPTTATTLQTAEIFAVDAAGAESNVASHCAHLGVSAAWVSALGDDPLGRRILADIADRGVDTSRVQFNPHAPTGVYFKDPGAGVHYYRAGSAASRMGPALLRDTAIESAQLLHLTGITPALSASCTHLVEAAIDAAHAAKVPISFDINYRSALWPLDTAAPVLLALGRRADTVFVGLDEAHTLWRCRTPEDVRTLFPRARLVVKNAEVGATEFSGEEHTFVPAPVVDVVEVVGAGDAFAAGYLAALLRGEGPAARLQAGHDQAARVLASTSDFVPTRGTV